MQAIEQTGGQEARHRQSAPLDEETAQATAMQFRHQGVQAQAALPGRRHWHHLGLTPVPGCCRPGSANQQGRCRPVLKDLSFQWQPSAGVENHPHGVVARHQARGQARVVDGHRLGADQHGIRQGTQTVQMADIRWPGDVTGLPTGGGDETIQALAQVGKGQGGGWHGRQQRQVEVEQGAGLSLCLGLGLGLGLGSQFPARRR